MKNNEVKILSNKPTLKRNAKVVTKHKDYIDFEGFENPKPHNLQSHSQSLRRHANEGVAAKALGTRLHILPFDIRTQTSICTVTLPL